MRHSASMNLSDPPKLISDSYFYRYSYFYRFIFSWDIVLCSLLWVLALLCQAFIETGVAESLAINTQSSTRWNQQWQMILNHQPLNDWRRNCLRKLVGSWLYSILLPSNLSCRLTWTVCVQVLTLWAMEWTMFPRWKYFTTENAISHPKGKAYWIGKYNWSMNIYIHITVLGPLNYQPDFMNVRYWFCSIVAPISTCGIFYSQYSVVLIVA